MAEGGADTRLDVVVKRKADKKSGFEVELREDGFFYISKIPPKCKSIGIGDRVLAINGTKQAEIKNIEHANDLFDTFRLGVVPLEDSSEEVSSDESMEETERRPGSKIGGLQKKEMMTIDQSQREADSDEAKGDISEEENEVSSLP
jgi:hypothetical protein